MTDEMEPRRGKEELEQAAQEMFGGKKSEISQEVINEGAVLLNMLRTSVMNNEPTPAQLVLLLTQMIRLSPFSSAIIEQVPTAPETGSSEALGNNIVIVGKYADGVSYNVWFARENDQWIVRYSKVPDGGNRR